MGWECSDVVRFELGPLFHGQKDDSLTLMSCFSGGYKFASALRCARSSLYIGLSILAHVLILVSGISSVL